MVDRQTGSRGPSSAADWIFTNGRILTFDARRPRATALAVAGGRIAAVGDRGDVKPWRGRRTEIVDLRDATVIPGLVDAHAHSPPGRRDAEGAVGRHHARRLAAVLSGPAEQARGEPLAYACRPRRRGARSSGLHPRHLGLLEQAAGLLDSQQ